MAKKCSKWQRHLMSVYRRNKKAGMAAAMKKAKKTFHRKKTKKK